MLGKDRDAFHSPLTAEVPDYALDRLPGGPIQILGVCTQGVDELVAVLARHGRAGDVHGELMVESGHIAAGEGRTAGLGPVEITGIDRWGRSAILGRTQSDLVVVHNSRDGRTGTDAIHVIATAAQLVRYGGWLVWTAEGACPEWIDAVRRTLVAGGLGLRAAHCSGQGFIAAAERQIFRAPESEPGVDDVADAAQTRAEEWIAFADQLERRASTEGRAG